MDTKNNLTECCKKFLGIYPYDTGTNILRDDSLYYASICKTFGKSETWAECKRLLAEKQNNQ